MSLGGSFWTAFVARLRYLCAYQPFLGLISVASSAQPAGTVNGLMIVWQTVDVVISSEME